MDSEKKEGKAAESKNSPSTLTRLRGSHKARLIIIGVLLLLVAILFVFWTKARIFLAIAFIALLAAFGLEATKNDFDLGKMLETKSIQQSKVSRDAEGNVLFDKFGNITTDSSKGKKADEYNCDDFTTKSEAQTFFNKVGGAQNDVNRLDGDKDGQACESLPQGSK